MIQIEGACHKCSKLTHNDFESYRRNNNTITCYQCWEKYYSEEAIRDAKLKKLLRRNIWQKLRDFEPIFIIRKYKNVIRNFVFRLLKYF
jgi:hypothetical protein